MSTLRILAPASAGGQTRWARLDPSGQVQAPGNEDQLEHLESDDEIELIVPAARILLIPAEISEEQRTRLSDGNLLWLAEPYLIHDAERMHIVAGTPSGDGKLPLCAVEHAWLSGILSKLAEKGIKPTRIVPETLIAQKNDDIWVAVLKAEGSFIRTGDTRGLLLDQTHGDNPPAVLTLALAKEPTPREILVHREENIAPPDLQQWGEHLGIPVRPGEIWNWTKPVPDGAINLACGAYAPPGWMRNKIGQFKPALWVLAGLLAINCLGLLATTGLGAMEKRRLNSEIETQLRTAFPQTTVILDPLAQMRQNVERLGRNAGIPTRNDFLPLLTKINTSLGKEISGRIETLRYESGVMVVELSLADISALNRLKGNIAASGLVVNTENLPSSGNSTRLRLNIKS